MATATVVTSLFSPERSHTTCCRHLNSFSIYPYVVVAVALGVQLARLEFLPFEITVCSPLVVCSMTNLANIDLDAVFAWHEKHDAEDKKIACEVMTSELNNEDGKLYTKIFIIFCLGLDVRSWRFLLLPKKSESARRT